MKKTVWNKKLLLFAAVLALSLLAVGCGAAKDGHTYLEEDKLTEEARALFSGLDGKHGVMVYQDASLFKRSEGRLYVVLYGQSGQALALESNNKELVLNISGAPMDGYTVWKVVYKRELFGERTISFRQNGQEQTMDGVETLEFVVEQANVIEE